MRQIKYQNYSVNGRDFTVKFTYLPHGGFHYTPTIKYNIMKYHELPKTLFEQWTEKLKFGLETDEWDPEYTELSLGEEVMNKLLAFKEKTFPAEAEWEKL